MHDLSIPIDPLNPGQFYACCGLQVIFDALEKDTLSQFSVDPRIPHRGSFLLTSQQDLDLAAALASLTFRVIPAEEDGLAPVEATIGSEKALRLNWWTTEFEDKKTPFKGWAGQVTPAKLFSELPRLLPTKPTPEGIMTHAVNTKTKFGVDPRSAWEAVNIGFSPNEHAGADVYPAVELLAAIGLQLFRPSKTGERKTFGYSLWLDPLPTMVAATAPWSGVETADYQFEVANRGSYAFFTQARPDNRNTKDN